MNTDGKGEEVKKGKALLHDRRLDDRGEEEGRKKEKSQEMTEQEKIKKFSTDSRVSFTLLP